jgi:hypothetical protein
VLEFVDRLMRTTLVMVVGVVVRVDADRKPDELDSPFMLLLVRCDRA